MYRLSNSRFLNPDQVSLSGTLDIFRDLLCAEFVCRFIMRGTRIENSIPLCRHLQAFVNREDAVSVKFCMGLVAIKLEKIRLVK